METRAPAVRRARCPLEPAASILIVEGDQLELASPDLAVTARVGHKAVGLVSIPASWTKRFFVVSGAKIPTTEALSAALLRSGIPPSAKLLVRSSGIDESIENRGELESAECTTAGLYEQIVRIQTAIGAHHDVHWVVQELVPCIADRKSVV